MSFKSVMKRLFGREGKTEIVDSTFEDLKAETAIRDLAFNTVVKYITDCVCKCPVDVYLNSKRLEGRDRLKSKEWYMFNFRPNANQSTAQFWQKAIYKLYSENEVLIIRTSDNQLLVADNFSIDSTSALYPHRFTGVCVDGLSFDRTFRRNEVIYLKLNNQDISDYLDRTTDLYGKMIVASYKNYIAGTGIKGFMKVSAFSEFDKEEQKKTNDRLKKAFDGLFEKQNGVVTLTEGYDFIPLQMSGQRVASTDFRSMLNECIGTVCLATGVPSVLITGQVAGIEQAIDQLLTFCVDPLVRLIEQEINATLNTPEELALGTGVFFYTRAIKHVDIIDVAQSVASAVSCGAYEIDEIRRACGDLPLPDGKGKQIIQTKNFEKEQKGGESDEQNSQP